MTSPWWGAEGGGGFPLSSVQSACSKRPPPKATQGSWFGAAVDFRKKMQWVAGNGLGGECV